MGLYGSVYVCVDVNRCVHLCVGGCGAGDLDPASSASLSKNSLYSPATGKIHK